MNKIPFNRAEIDEQDLENLRQSILSGHISGNGHFTKQAELQINQTLGSNRTLLTTSCTHALEMTALLLKLGPGDEVIVPSYTFVSTASAYLMHGAKPVFVDVDPLTLNIAPELVEAAVTPRTRAICMVHYGGVACEMEKLLQIALKYNIILIEDNAHGLFAKYKGKYLGSFGAMATQSFHETKNITCGEGGALVINNPELVERAEILREKGTDRTKFLRGQVDKYTWVDIGSSWVMSDMLAAVLCGQIARAESINRRRSMIWQRYNDELKSWALACTVKTPFIPQGCEHTAHLYHLRFGNGTSRDRFIEHLKNRGILAVFHYQALNISKIGLELGGKPGQCPVSEQAADCLVRLPLFNTLSTNDQSRIIEAVIAFD